MLLRLYSFIYKILIKRVLFLFDPEVAHVIVLKFGYLLGNIKLVCILLDIFLNKKYSNLYFKIKNVNFNSPVGLSAGFDKNGDIIELLPFLGFGHAEIGSATIIPYSGNQKPRLKRFPKIRSVWVNFGLKNIGTKEILKRFNLNSNSSFTYGISIAKSNTKDNCDDENAIQDYLESFKLAIENKFIKYITINISCPNTFGGEPFTDRYRLKSLLDSLDKIDRFQLVFIKMPISLDDSIFLDLLDEISKHKIDGVVIGNLLKDKSILKDFKINEVILKKGGLSGKPTFERSNQLIELTYRYYKDRFIIVGCGGIFSAEDVITKIKLGATLVQLATGLIFEGPTLIYKINRDLSNLVRSMEFQNIKEIVGIGVF